MGWDSAQNPTASNPNIKLPFVRPDAPPRDKVNVKALGSQTVEGDWVKLRVGAVVDIYESTLEADEIDYNLETGEAHARGHVHYKNYEEGESISPDAAKVARSTVDRNARSRGRQRAFDIDDPPEIQKALEFPEELLESRTVERALYTNARVAVPSHRAMAVAYDMAMIAIGVGILTTIYYLGGVQFGLARLDLSTYAIVAVCVTLLYKILWALSGGDTPGMAAVNLRLINFDGNRPSREERLMRVLVSIVSFAALGVGLLWSLFDEEKLTWHYHITKTFSSPRLNE